ncbi:MAG: choice-of-anchor Q domain-containing protein, partial [Burkholderiales bacterium]
CIRFDSPHLVAAIYNNTFSDCAIDNDPDSGGIRFQKAMQVTLINNIVSGKYYVNVGSMPTIFTSSHNLWFGKGAAPTWDTHSISADPRFVNPSAGDFRLRASSPAINRGSSSVNDVVTTDFDGIARPQGGGYDIGAFEFIRPAPSQQQHATPETRETR